MADKRYALTPEMFWRPDPELDAARKLPKWARFHRACGEQKLYFDHIQREGKRGPYKCVAFKAVRNAKTELWDNYHVADGHGKTVLECLADAFAKSGYDIPEAAALLAAGLRDAPAPVVADEFDALIDDEFEGLL